jgi:hypothetical protein
MRRAIAIATPLLVLLTACGGGTSAPPVASSTPTPTPVPAPSPEPRVFAPYAYVAETPPFAITRVMSATGHKHYTLAFFQDGGGCTPKWGGGIPLSDNHYADEIDAVRAGGGDVIFSFGGADGVDLALACGSADALQSAYQQVVTQYHATSIDLDVEGSPLSDPPSVDRRNKALRALEGANPTLRVSYTLPVDPSGLTSEGLDLLRNALVNATRVDVVNVMAMDYGGPHPNMGQDAISAAESTLAQIRGLGLQASIGVTVMIGQNDEAAEVFGLNDADALLTYAKANSFVSRLAMWSVNRDNGSCAGLTTASSTCSGITQSDFAFTNAVKAF